MHLKSLYRIQVWIHSVFLITFLNGCSYVPLPDEARHVIRVNENGELRTLDNLPAPPGYAEANLIGPLREALSNSRTAPQRGVLIFVHGGLNTYQQAREHFVELSPQLQAEGYYPLFLLWPSGLVGTYGDHLLNIRQGRREPQLGVFSTLTIPLVLVQDLATGLVHTPMTSLSTLRSDLQTAISPASPSSQAAAIDIYRRLVEAGQPVEIGTDYKTQKEMAVRVASYWTTLPTKLATAGPIIDALGQPAWDDMIRRTYMVYPGALAGHVEQLGSNKSFPAQTLTMPGVAASGTASPGPNELADQARVERKNEANRSGFAALISALETLQEHPPRAEPVKVTLVGHSMGAIVLNHLLEETKLEADRIIYLAAACSVRDFSTSVLPYLEKHQQTVSYNVSLHPMAEDGEWQKSFLDLPPRGSLLVWIDNFLSNPVYEQDRTFGRWTNLFMVSPTGNSAIEDILYHRGITGRLHFRSYGIGSGNTPRGPEYQWNETKKADSRKDSQTFPERHSDLAKLLFWRDALP